MALLLYIGYIGYVCMTNELLLIWQCQYGYYGMGSELLA